MGLPGIKLARVNLEEEHGGPEQECGRMKKMEKIIETVDGWVVSYWNSSIKPQTGQFKILKSKIQKVKLLTE